MTSGSDMVDRYRTEIMMPTVKEFLEDPGDRRRAFLAAITVSHLADYIFEGRIQLRGSLTEVDKYLKWLTTKCWQWGLVRDIGDASRHCRLTRRTSAVIKDQSFVQPQRSSITTEKGQRLITEGGDYITTEGQMYVRTPDGQEHEVTTLLREAL